MTKSKKAKKCNKLTEFTCFKSLALELRDMIWKAAILSLGSNVVDIEGGNEYNATKTTDKKGNVTYVYRPVVLKASYKVPVHLQVSRESRRVALSIYTKLLPNKFAEKPVYFNLTVDVLSIQDENTLVYLCSLGSFRLDWKYGPPTVGFTSPIMQGLRRLQLRKNMDDALLQHIRKILEAFGKPELVVAHNSRPKLSRYWCGSWCEHCFDEFKRMIKYGSLDYDESEIEEEEEGTDEGSVIKDFATEVHYLTDFQLKKMIKKLDYVPARPKRIRAPKGNQLPTRRSERSTERPLTYFEEELEIEAEDTKYGGQADEGAEVEDQEIDIETTDDESMA